MTSCVCRWPSFPSNPTTGGGVPHKFRHGFSSRKSTGSRVSKIRALMMDSQENSSNFTKRIEQAWLISQQPRPAVCTSCKSKGTVECKWCAGTGFFIIGDNMLCQVPSKNTTCVICTGKGSGRCSDCQGTGFRAKWLATRPSPND